MQFRQLVLLVYPARPASKSLCRMFQFSHLWGFNSGKILPKKVAAYFECTQWGTSTGCGTEPMSQTFHNYLHGTSGPPHSWLASWNPVNNGVKSKEEKTHMQWVYQIRDQLLRIAVIQINIELITDYFVKIRLRRSDRKESCSNVIQKAYLLSNQEGKSSDAVLKQQRFLW